MKEWTDRQGQLSHGNLSGQMCEHHKAPLKEKRRSCKPGTGLEISSSTLLNFFLILTVFLVSSFPLISMQTLPVCLSVLSLRYRRG